MYLDLFLSFFQIGLFSFGGGMAAIPLISEQVVAKHGWLTFAEFTDLVTIAEMTPGPIAVNSSTFVGTRIGGILGALVATAGCILPSCIIVSVLAWLYFRYENLSWIQGVLGGLRPAIVALISSAGLSILSLALLGEPWNWSLDVTFNAIGFGLFAAALLVLRKWKINPIYVMLCCGICGGILYTQMGGAL